MDIKEIDVIRELKSTNKLLRVIVSLLLKRKEKDLLPLKEQVEILYDSGLKPIEIAEIIGRSNLYVNKEISGIRKNREQKK
ncbi:MAG: hypothetical protein NT155_00740 [Candidatus Staskawiczbacteria bacterium]|nr:hypothetical protein [Candidatus Staskawiczbacteria bacterium]